jgi:hypothetical protein
MHESHFQIKKLSSHQKKKHVRDIHVKILKYHVNHASRKIRRIPKIINSKIIELL